MLAKLLLTFEELSRVDSAVALFSARDCCLFSSLMRIARDNAWLACGGLLASPAPAIGGLPEEALVLPPAGVPPAVAPAFST